MDLYEQLNTDIVSAIKNKGDTVLLNTLRNIKNSIVNENIELRKKTDSGVDDNKFLEIVIKLTKQRKDSIDQFTVAGRNDLIEKEEKELKILQTYLPKQISDAELKNIVFSHIKKLDASSLKDMGRVIQSVISEVGMSAEKSKISLIVKENLS